MQLHRRTIISLVNETELIRDCWNRFVRMIGNVKHFVIRRKNLELDKINTSLINVRAESRALSRLSIYRVIQ